MNIIRLQEDLEAQQSNYSGEENWYTYEHLTAVDKTRWVLLLSKARKGKLHEKRYHDKEKMFRSITKEFPPVEIDLDFWAYKRSIQQIASL